MHVQREDEVLGTRTVTLGRTETRRVQPRQRSAQMAAVAVAVAVAAALGLAARAAAALVPLGQRRAEVQSSAL